MPPAVCCSGAVYVIPVILIVLNSMWFYKILKGVIKLLNPDKPKDKSKTS
jgi:hypothetical protein